MIVFTAVFFTKVALEVQDDAVQARCRQFRTDLAALLMPHLNICWPHASQAKLQLALLFLLKDGAETAAALQTDPQAALHALQIWRRSVSAA